MAPRLFPARGVTVARAEPVRLLRAGAPVVQNAVISTSEELARVMRREGTETESGAHVTPDSAMRTAAVFSCVRVLSEDIAALPIHVYRWIPRGKERVTDHWLVGLLRQPNPWQTGFEFREMQQAHLELCGNFYALKTVVRDEVRELLPLTPDRVSVVVDGVRLRYDVTMPDGTTKSVPAERMYHVRGMTLNGVEGISTIRYQRELVGLAQQQQTFGAKLYKHGAMIGGMLEYPKSLSKDAADRLLESFDAAYSGAWNAHKTVLLEEGMKYARAGMSAEEAQWLDARKFGSVEVCGIFRVPPHKIGNLDRATFSNIEQQETGYTVDAIVPRTTRLDARMAVSLLSDAEQKTTFVQHVVDGRMRGDTAARTAAYQTAVSTGWMTPNEVRERENLPPGPAKLDEFLTPAFLVGKQAPPSGESGDPAPANRRLSAA